MLCSVKLPQKAMTKKSIVEFFILALCVILLRAPSLIEPFDKDSSANAYGAWLIVQGEPLYGYYHPAHHLPAIYYIYALGFALFGNSLFAVKFLLLLWTIPTAYLLYRLAHYFTPSARWLAPILFVLLTTDNTLQGNSAQIELFANLPRIGAILLLIYLVKHKKTDGQFGLLGLVGAICFLFKAVYLAPLALAGLISWLELGYSRQFARRMAWLILGFGVGLCPVMVYFGSLGLLPRVVAIFTMGQAYVDSATPGFWAIFFYPFLGLTFVNLPLLLMGLVGAWLIGRDRAMPLWQRVIIPIWLLFSWLEAGFSRKPFMHYYLLLIPPLTLLTAYFIVQLSEVKKNYPQLRPLITITLTLLLASIGLVYGYHNGNYLRHYVRYQLGQETYREFVLHRWPFDGAMLVDIQDLATYVQAHSTPTDQIYIWDSGLQIYYLAQRRCPLHLIWPEFINTVAVQGSSAEVQARLLASTTKFILLGFDNPPAWLTQGLAEHYQVVKVIGQRKLYQRR